MWKGRTLLSVPVDLEFVIQFVIQRPNPAASATGCQGWRSA